MSGDRFTLLLLEPGEIYFQDLAVNYIYDETKALTEENFQRGWLKICSKSIVFVPIKERNKDPLLKFPLNDVSEIIGNLQYLSFRITFLSHVTCEKTSLFLRQNTSFFKSRICFDSFDLTRFFPISEWLPKSFRSPLASQSNVIALTCDGRVEMLDKNTLAPFKFVRGVKSYIFSFKYAKVNDHLSLMNQLRRAATLPPIEQNGMIATIVYSIQSRSSFDHCWLETAQEQILHKVTPSLGTKNAE